MKSKISNAEINKIVSAAIRKKSKQEPKMTIEEVFQFGGKDFKLKFTRRYHRGRTSLCKPIECNAGDGCCHLRKVDDINLCYTGSDYFDLLRHKNKGIIIDGIDESTENQIFCTVRNILDLISEQILEGE